MTIDTLIRMLEEAKTILPQGGQSQVCFPDFNLLMKVTLSENHGLVFVSDVIDGGKK